MVDTSYYCRGQIWYRSNTREEEGRSVITKVRPVLIVSNNVGLAYSNIAIVVPLTSSPRLRTLPTQVPIDVNGRPNWVLCEQMYCTSTVNLDSYVGMVQSQKMKEIDKALQIAIGSDDVVMLDRSKSADDGPEAFEDENVDESSADSVIESDNTTVRESSRKPRRPNYSEDEMLDMLIKAESMSSRSMEEKQQFAKDAGFSSWGSYLSTINRFKRRLNSL